MTIKGKKIGFVGAGNMGEAMIKGLLAANLVPPAAISATDVRLERLKELDRQYGIQIAVDNPELVRHADVVILAVKPQIIEPVLEEAVRDAVTGLSGSGPAYVALVIESLADGGVKMGLDRITAMTLATQTVLGAAKLLLETGLHPGALKDMVSSPGGTSIAGIAALEEGGIRTTFITAVERATQRSRELGMLR